MNKNTPDTYEGVRERLDAIVQEVHAEGISLDEALKLYEEAVILGLLAYDLSEEEALAQAEALEAADNNLNPETSTEREETAVQPQEGANITDSTNPTEPKNTAEGDIQN